MILSSSSNDAVTKQTPILLENPNNTSRFPNLMQRSQPLHSLTPSPSFDHLLSPVKALIPSLEFYRASISSSPTQISTLLKLRYSENCHTLKIPNQISVPISKVPSRPSSIIPSTTNQAKLPKKQKAKSRKISACRTVYNCFQHADHDNSTRGQGAANSSIKQASRYE